MAGMMIAVRGGTAQCGESAIALAKPSQGAQVRQSHTRHLR
jgi:hypothetical protein